MKRLLVFLALMVLVTGRPWGVWAQSPARQAGYRYLSPVPSAPFVSQYTRYVLVRLDSITPAQIANLTENFITVVGAVTGLHTGSTRMASDGRTVMFQMGANFITNELVTITLNPLLVPAAKQGSLKPYQYQVMIEAPMPGSQPLVKQPSKSVISLNDDKVAIPASTNPVVQLHQPKAITMSNGVSVPSDFPQIVITVNSNPSPGYLFMENGLDGGAAAYTMIVDNNGLPVWYRRGRMYDFKIQKNGMITWCLDDATGFPAFDQNFNYLKTYLTTNGYLADGHELKILADGTYFMIGYQTNIVDMSQYVAGGLPGSIVRETVVQEFTSADDLILQWRAWDNYDMADENWNTDFPHMNALDIDEDGNILVSARHLSEVTKIDRDTGDIIWRLSGVHSSFSFTNDPFSGTSFQHNISALGNGHYMVFDNGNYHVPMISRAVEYQLDLTNMIATLVWQFRDTPDKYTYWLGNAQRLPSGNTLINFVRPEYPKAIEVDTNGVKHFELGLIPNSDSYRVFRLPWVGPAAVPYLVLEPQPDNLTLIFNKFGDTNVAYYRIYGGTSPHPTALLDESTSTMTKLSNLQNGTYYFRVTAMSGNGIESPFSNEVSTYVNITSPGANMVQNGSFSQGQYEWALGLGGGSKASWNVNDGIAQFSITNGGASLASVQLFQFSKALIQGNQYVLEFDGWSSGPRYIEVKVAQSNPPNLDYSQIAPPFLTPNRQHYRFVFTMKQPSDFSANLLFNMGASPGKVYLANIILFNPSAGDLNMDGSVDYLDLGNLMGNWLKQQSGLPTDLNHDGRVDFSDFNILGQNWSVSPP
jgi:hypothetical protein